MASLKEIKTRVNSVKSTRKVTSAMRMVSSAKLHKAQGIIGNMVPYQKKLDKIVGNFLSGEISVKDSSGKSSKNKTDFESPFVAERPVRKIAIVAFSSNSSLCGAFNYNIIKAFTATVLKYTKACTGAGSGATATAGGTNANNNANADAQTSGVANGALSESDILVYPIGKKIEEAAKRMGFTAQTVLLPAQTVQLPSQNSQSPDKGERITLNLQLLAAAPSYSDISVLALKLMKMYAAGEIDRVEVIYHHFKSTSVQSVETMTWLPVDLSAYKKSASEAGAGECPGAGSGSGSGAIAGTFSGTNANVSSAAVAGVNVSADSETSSNGASSSHDVSSLHIEKYINNYIVEPSVKEIIASLIPQVLQQQLYTALADSYASEHAARTIAMQVATDNADDLIQELTVQYNKSRQQSITSELLDIVGGSMK